MSAPSAASEAWFNDATPLPGDDTNVLQFVLSNGLRVCAANNSYPPNRCCVWLDVAAGSLHETGDEQGLAHLLEHCVFTKTQKYSDLTALKDELARLGMSYGGDSNAYTIFCNTVYNLEAPVLLGGASDAAADTDDEEEEEEMSDEEDEDMEDEEGGDEEEEGDDDSMGEGEAPPPPLSSTTLPTLLDILHELAFNAQFDSPAVDTERGAVVSEASMRNTIDYRVDVALTAQLHADNAIPRRMPIGLISVVQACSPARMQSFYKRHYRPEVMTLYIVGPFPDKEALMKLVAGTFEAPGPVRTLGVFDVLDAAPNAAHTDLVHNFSQPPPQPLCIVQHPLLHAYCCMLTWKLPLNTYETRTRDQFALAVLDIVASYVFDDRLSTLRQKCAHPAYSDVTWDDSPFCEEACGTRSISVTADVLIPTSDDASASDGFGSYAVTGPLPAWTTVAWTGSKWQRATTIAFREVLRLVQHGVMEKELRLACAIFLKELLDRKEAAATQENETVLEELQNSVYTSSTQLSPVQEYEFGAAVLKEITVERANARIRETLGFVADLGARAVAVMENVHAGDADAAACGAALFDGAGKALSIFVAAPGRADTLSPITSQVAAACTREAAAVAASVEPLLGADDALLTAPIPLTRTASAGTAVSAVSGGAAMDVDGDGTPSVYDRMQRMGGRHARLARAVTGGADGEQGETAAAAPIDLASAPPQALDTISPLQVIAAIAHAMLQVTPPTDLDVPSTLISEEEMEAKARAAIDAHAAAGIPLGFVNLSAESPELAAQFDATLSPMLAGKPGEIAAPPPAPHRLVDGATGLCMLRCSNGLTVMYKATRLEPNQVHATVLARLGRSVEGESAWTWGLLPGDAAAPTLQGTLAAGLTYGAPAFERSVLPHGSTELGVRTTLSSGAGRHSAEVLNRLGTLWGLSLHCNSYSEFLSLSSSASSADGGLEHVLQLLHLAMVEPRWDAAAFQRARDALITDCDHMRRNLDRLADWSLTLQAYGGDVRMHNADYGDDRVKRVELDTVRQVVHELFVPGNAMLVVSGDFTPDAVEAAVQRYMTIIPMPPIHGRVLKPYSAEQTAFADGAHAIARVPLLIPPAAPISGASSWSQPWPELPLVLSGRVVRTSDPEERSCVLMLMPAPGKYPSLPDATGLLSDEHAVLLSGSHTIDRAHPLFLYRASNIILEVMNNRLFKALRDDAGICYAVSYGQNSAELMHAGQAAINATSLPVNAPRALSLACHVLWAMFAGTQPITSQEFTQAHAPLVQDVRSNLRTRSYWHALASHISTGGSMKRMRHLHGIPNFYENLTLDDVHAAVRMYGTCLPSPLPIHVTVGVSGPERVSLSAADAPLAFDRAPDGTCLPDASAWTAYLNVAVAAGAADATAAASSTTGVSSGAV